MSRFSTRVALLVEDLYQDLEVWYPLYRLREAGIEVLIVGTGTKAEYRGKYGYPITPTTTVDRVSIEDLDGVIIPGGYAPDLLRRSPGVLKLVREAHRQGKVIGAICHAGWVLCSADILRGKTVTCFSAIKDDMVNAGATFVDREVVRDGMLITARKPDDLPAFMRAILAALATPTPAPHGRRHVAKASGRR